jgi:hypothetical protein
MTDSINRIIPPHVAPERYSIVRRERDDSESKKQQSNNDFSDSARPSSETENPPTVRDNEEKQPKTKGKILDISA